MDFFVTLINKYKLYGNGEKKLIVHLPARDEIRPLELFIQDYPKGNTGTRSLIWAAGGGTYLLGNEYVPLIKRSADSISNPGKLTIATGLSNSYEEMVDPLLLIRELFEEIVMIDKNNSLLVPLFSGINTPHYKDINQFAHESITSSAQKIGLSWLSIKFLKAEIVLRLLFDEVSVMVDDILRTRTKALIHLNEAQGKVNILFAVHLPEIKDIQYLCFFDTETRTNSNGTSTPLNREIFLFNIRTNDLLSVNDFKCIEYGYDMTDHANFMITSIKSVYENV